MDQELLDLYARLLNEDNPLSDEELADLRSRISARVDELRESVSSGTVTDDDIAALTEAVEASNAVQAEIDGRAAAQAERQAAAEALLSQIAPSAEADGGEGDGGEGDDDTGNGEGDAGTADGGEGDASTTEGTGSEAEGTEGEVEPVPIAAAAEAPRLPSISRLAHRTPRTHRPVATATERAARPVLVASADIPGLAAGEPCELEQFARASARKLDAIRKVRGPEGDGEKIYLGTVRAEYPDDRMLTDDEWANEEKILAVTSRPALVASGGVCSPVAVSYDVASIGVADRPVRDAAAQFGATRGGLRYIRPHTLAQVTADGPASVWTETNDVTPTNPTTKPHAVFQCQTVQEDFVDAVTSIVQFGNFQARFFPEQIAQYLETVDVVHARLAEATLLAAITSGSTAVNSGVNLLGAASEVLAEIDRAVAALRFRHRMAPDSPIRCMYPEWLEDLIRADLAREAPGNSGGQSERLAVADAEIDRFFMARNLNPSYTLDSPTGASVFQGWGVQGVGDLLPWPSKVTIWLFPEGSWMFLDGGELNLGMVRDSTLNRTNDFQMFSETFEKMIFRGHESLALTLDTCVSGQRASLVDTASYCTSGS